MLQKYELLCCSLEEQRPEPTPWLEGVANPTVVIVLVSMPKGHSWVDMLSAPLHCLPPPPSPWKQAKMFLINSRALTCLPLYGALIKLPSIVVSKCSHVTSANKNAGWKESFCLPAMESSKAPDSPLAKLYMSVFSLLWSFSPAVLDTAIIEHSLYGCIPKTNGNSISKQCTISVYICS